MFLVLTRDPSRLFPLQLLATEAFLAFLAFLPWAPPPHHALSRPLQGGCGLGEAFSKRTFDNGDSINNNKIKPIGPQNY